MWGQARCRHLPIYSHRIIPTRVGTRIIILRELVMKQDHPHACGDKSSSTKSTYFTLGSSPRVWGQAYSTPESRTECRIIPTRVGTSHSRFLSLQLRKDHPHACGDKKTSLAIYCLSSGSSPRVWGQEKVIYIVTDSNRIIPTRVGTSFNNMLISGEARDHPHACGDKILQ